jgi:SPP1 family predicted phage head-tail adaptor
VRQYVNIATAVPAKIETTGRKVVVAQQVHADVTAIITIRYRRGLTKELKVVYGGNTFQALYPPNDPGQAHENLIIECAEVV